MASTELDLSSASWRKSSYSNGTGGDCVEVAEAFPSTARWRKSTYSNSSGGECVEVADGVTGVVPVRDSKVPNGPVLLLPASAWSGFVAGLR